MAPDLKKAYSKKLEDMKPYVTGAEIKEAASKFEHSRTTIYRYLDGEVGRIDVAEKLINYFSPLVKQRIGFVKKVKAA